jgi:hypothetical protein
MAENPAPGSSDILGPEPGDSDILGHETGDTDELGPETGDTDVLRLPGYLVAAGASSAAGTSTEGVS